jgi:adenylate cyclase
VPAVTAITVREVWAAAVCGGTGPRVALALLLAQSCAAACQCETDAIDLGGQRREIATLFTDIARFTTLVETLEPSVLGLLLNDYLVGMTDIVFTYDGTVAKIVGDALHVLFGAPGEQLDHCTRAVACALALDEYAQSFRDRCRQKGILLGVTRIGAHAGPAIVGNFGGGRFFDYTAYGDTINVAARLETANKQLGTRICVSADLATKAEDFRGRLIGDLVLRGKSESFRAFEPLQVSQYEDPSTKSYMEAFAKLECVMIRVRSLRSRRM